MKPALGLASLFALAISTPALAVPIQWTSAAGGNGHWYEVVVDGSKGWNAASAAAVAAGGYLVTITSAAEQSFINSTLFGGTASGSTVSNESLIGSWWMGATDTASEGTWQWVKAGEAFGAFTNWGSGQPDNNSNAQFGGTAGEDYGQFVWRNGWTSTLPGGWNDAREAGYSGPDYSQFPQLQLRGYIVEWDRLPIRVPEPGALAVAGSALVASVFALRRRRRHT
jgi:hypothetical protein